LFNLIGTTYGGDGQSTFALPDLRGRVPIHQGTNPSNGITHTLAEKSGTETVTLTANQIPTHSHPMLASADPASAKGAANQVLARAPADAYASEFTPDVLNAQSITTVGGSQPHENMQPYLCVNFIISLFGIYPSPT
jgi:microcystin-dependent protein